MIDLSWLTQAKLYKQKAVLQQWGDHLAGIEAIDVIWLEGSLVKGRKASPSSDIDLRLGIADAVYDDLSEPYTALLLGVGDYLALAPFRFLTPDGVVVELMSVRSSALDGKALYEWQILFSRLPEADFTFKQRPPRSPAETWPHSDKVTTDLVRRLNNIMLHLLAGAAAPFYLGEIHSAIFALEELRHQLMELLYRRVGVWFFKRYKHLSTVLPPEFLADLAYTQIETGQSPLDPSAIAAATLRTFAMIQKHLQALSDQAGGGFEAPWFARLFEQVEVDLAPWLFQNGA